MTILLEIEDIPEQGNVDLNIHYTFNINITAEEAQKQVNHWLRHEVSYLFGAEAPRLAIGDKVVWRVPAIFSTPSVGRVGMIGVVEVEVENGKMYNAPECQAALESCAEKLAQYLPAFQPKKAPVQYLAKELPSSLNATSQAEDQPKPQLTPLLERTL